jgi:hypothetical protein
MLSQVNNLKGSQIGCLKVENNVLSPRGRLKCNYMFWHDTDANSYVRDVVQNGYKLPMFCIPTSIALRNNVSSRNNPEFVDLEIDKLLKLDLIENVQFIPEVVNPLTVATGRSGKRRLVLDCRHINLCLHKYKFCYEDGDTAKHVVNTGDVAFQFDLRSAYHHIEISEEHRKYLGFCWRDKYFVFNVLPFGLSTAGLIFTKVMRHPVRYWRAQGIRVVMFLDDGIVVAGNQEQALIQSKIIQEDLQKFGFIVAEEKSDWVPKSRVRWLGLNWYFDKGFIHLPSDRLSGIITDIEGVLSNTSSTISVRKLASVIGKIQSARLAMGNVVLIKTKYCHMCVESRIDWDGVVILTDKARSELLFWQEYIVRLNGKPFIENIVCDVTVCSDASGVGFGGYVAERQGVEAIGRWSSTEMTESSTWRELKAVHKVLYALKAELKNQRVQWRVDNMNVIHIMRKGSMKAKLQNVMIDIFNVSEAYNILIFPVWIPRAENGRADLLSRLPYKDADDWKVNFALFHRLNRAWGPFTVDRFATSYNTKCQRFNSKVWFKGTEAVNCFTVNWSGENNWLVPPPSLISEAIKKMSRDEARGVLILPCWKSAPYWPIIFPDGEKASFVSDVYEFPLSGNILPGRGRNGVFSGNYVFDMVAVLIDFGLCRCTRNFDT